MSFAPGHNMILEPGNLFTSAGIRFCALSGGMTGIAAGADVCGWRNASARPIAVSRIALGWNNGTGFTVAQSLGFTVFKVTGFTAIHNAGAGGSAVTTVHRRTTGFDAIPQSEIAGFIAGTAAITGAVYNSPTANAPLIAAMTDIYITTSSFNVMNEVWCAQDTDGIPEVLEADEGIVVRMLNTMGAGGNGNLFVRIDAYRM